MISNWNLITLITSGLTIITCIPLYICYAQEQQYIPFMIVLVALIFIFNAIKNEQLLLHQINKRSISMPIRLESIQYYRKIALIFGIISMVSCILLIIITIKLCLFPTTFY